MYITEHILIKIKIPHLKSSRNVGTYSLCTVCMSRVIFDVQIKNCKEDDPLMPATADHISQ